MARSPATPIDQEVEPKGRVLSPNLEAETD
jgi:hypothetical protein